MTEIFVQIATSIIAPFRCALFTQFQAIYVWHVTETNLSVKIK